MQKMRAIFINNDGQWRIPWRILMMFVLVIAAALAINKGWRVAGLPGQKAASPSQFLGFVLLLVAATLSIIRMLLRIFEQRGFDAIWLPLNWSAWKPLALGTLLGAIPIMLLVAMSVLGGYGEIASANVDASVLIAALVPTLAAMFLISGQEELVMRGYLFRQIALARGPLIAAVVTGILFGLAHSANPGANWQGLLFTAIGGTLMGLLLVRSGSLWLLVGYHFGWNAVSGNVFGLEVSGMDVQSTVFLTTLSGSEWLTGGDYGFESSLPAVFLELAVLSGALLYLYKKGPEPKLEL